VTERTAYRKIAPGIYEYNGFTVMKVARNCWRVTSKGGGDDFMTLGDALYFCENGGSLFPPVRNEPQVKP
jgi:hypothetical protein